MRVPRWLLVGAGIAVIVTVAIAPGAIAAGASSPVLIPPGTPPVVNVLPSVAQASLPVSGGTAMMQYNAVMMYKFAQTPEFYAAIKALEDGKATASQLELIDTTTATHKIPATKMATLAKTVGGVTSVVSAYTLGTWIGGGVLDIVGFDSEGTVCAAASGAGQVALGLLTGVNCDNFNAFHAEYSANGDVLTEPSGTLCTTDLTYCVTFAGVFIDLAFNSAVGVCMKEVGTFPDQHQFRMATSIHGPDTYVSAIRATNAAWLGANCGGQLPFLRAINTTTLPTVYGVKLTNQLTDETTSTLIEQPDPDPLRTLKCVTLGTDANTYTAFSEPYTEGSGVLASPKCADLPSGVDAASITVDEVLGDTSTRLWEQETTPEYQEHQTLYPECADGTCLLELKPTTGTLSCFQSPESCADWFSDPNKETNYSCTYGTHAVSLAECTLYANSFKPDSVTSGNTISDPETGQPWQAPAGSLPGVATGGMGAPVQDPEQARNCLPTGWGVLNPVEWVMKPVQCALEWAFVPRPAQVQAIGARVVTAWDATSIRQVTSLVGSIPAMVPSGAGSCLGPPVTFDSTVEKFGMTGTWYPLNSCSGAMATAAAFFKTATVVVIGFFALLAIVRYFANVVGFEGIGRTGKGEAGE